ncbi:MAG: O-methyltransferase [bacterium]|nr:O-methyltransferase [bacterium]
MLRTFVLVFVLATALVGTTSLLGQERGAAPLTQILDDLKKAYDANDREKMGQLLKDMSESAQRFERGIGGRARGMGPGGGPPMRGGIAPSTFDSPPVPKTDDDKKILGVLDDMYSNQSRGMMNVSPADGRLLRLLTEAAGAKHVVEIGTSNGYSGIWFCLALRTTGGKLTTHEIDARRASLARENFKRAGVAEIVTLVEGDAHETVKNIKQPIDVLFLDADKEGYIDYFNKLLPIVRPGGLILAHNTSGQAGAMQDYIKAVTTNPDLETVFQNTQGEGIGVTLKKR